MNYNPNSPSVLSEVQGLSDLVDLLIPIQTNGWITEFPEVLESELLHSASQHSHNTFGVTFGPTSG